MGTMARPVSRYSAPRIAWLLLAAGVAGHAGRGRAFDQAQAMLTIDFPVAQVGQLVNLVLTVSSTGVNSFNYVNPTLTITSGSECVQLTYYSTPGGSVFIAAGTMQNFYWTYSVTGRGEVHFTGIASGYINSVAYSVSSSNILLIPGPSAPAIRILNNHLRPGRSARIVLHGTPAGAATLTVFDQTGAPLGPAGSGAVALDGSGNGSLRFDGVVAGRRLSTGLYWIVVTGSAAGKAPLLITDR